MLIVSLPPCSHADRLFETKNEMDEGNWRNESLASIRDIADTADTVAAAALANAALAGRLMKVWNEIESLSPLKLHSKL